MTKSGPDAPEVRLLYFDDCANWRIAEARLHEALAGAGLDVEIDHELVEGFERADQLGFIGSPTILIDGVDPFAEPGAPVGFACRMYLTDDGPQGSPSLLQLQQAIKSRLLGTQHD